MSAGNGRNRPPDKTHDLIVIGTSSGGVQALRRIVGGLRTDLRAAVMVVIHLSPSHPTKLHSILDSLGTLPCELATNMGPLEPGRLYVAPPDHHLLVAEDHMRVVRGPKENGHRPAVDPLFRTAAMVYGARVIGVILTGALDCGAEGLAQIKARGGLAIVQDPATAEVPSMPSAALRAVRPDHVVPLDEIADLLNRLAGSPAGQDVAQEPVTTGPEVMEPGTASGLTCPACGGSIWESSAAQVVKFRCRVGHAYSTDGLTEAQADDLDYALWQAIRVLEETAAVSRTVAARARARGDLATQELHVRRALNAEQQAMRIHDVVQRIGAPVDRDGPVK